MYEIRIFEFHGMEYPTVYHRKTLPEAIMLIHSLPISDAYKIELININKYPKSCTNTY
jgi:hypothetical protein